MAAVESDPRGRQRARRDGSLFCEAEWHCLAQALHLSRRELQIVRGIFNDRKEASIAQELGISAHTVHTYLERLYRKLGVRSRCGVILRIVGEHLGR